MDWSNCIHTAGNLNKNKLFRIQQQVMGHTLSNYKIKADLLLYLYK